jgi:hypothetical protein
MTPVRSNSSKENCAPISSNCIIWQGASLPCLSLCREDSVSDVIYRIAKEVCDIKASFDYTSVDLSCLLTVCNVITPEPTKTLNNILNLVITKVCCLSDIVNQINTNPPAEKEVTLVSCLKPYLSPTGVPYTTLPVSEYLYVLALKVCDVITTVSALNTRVTVLEAQVATLINTPPPTIPQVVSNCVTGANVIPGVPANVNDVVEALEADYCNLVSALGGPDDLIKIKTNPCLSTVLTNPIALSDSSKTLSSLFPGQWVAAPLNAAQALRDLWVMVCDLRAAVNFIQKNCCKISCDTLIVDFDVKRTNDPKTGQVNLNLFFYPKTNLPSDWYDCNQSVNTNPRSTYTFLGNELLITDQAGHEYKVRIPLRKQDLSEGILNDQQSSYNGFLINLSDSPLDTESAYTITSNICVTDGTSTCVKCINKNVPYTPVKCAYCEIKASETVTITYRTCPTTTTTMEGNIA